MEIYWKFDNGDTLFSLRSERNRQLRHARFCEICDNLALDEEYHFVLKCKRYDNLRRKYIKQYNRRKPSMVKLTLLLKTSNTKELMSLSRYEEHSICNATDGLSKQQTTGLLHFLYIFLNVFSLTFIQVLR